MVLELRDLIKVFKQYDQIQIFRPLKWDLNLVIRTCYESLAMAPLQTHLWKTPFLLGFTMAAQISELHVLDIIMTTRHSGSFGPIHGLFTDINGASIPFSWVNMIQKISFCALCEP